MHLHPSFLFLLTGFLFIWTCGTCSKAISNQQKVSQGGRHFKTSLSEEASKGLDLESLVGIVKEVKTAEEFESTLNQPNGINNLDLNGDGKVDYINVTEYGSKAKASKAYGFSLTTEVEKGEVQELATVEMTSSGNQVDVQVGGNEQIYGRGSYYNSYFPVSSFLLWSYLLTPHPFYASPWGYGYYPGSYYPYSRVPYGAYSSRTEQYKRNTGVQKTSSLKNTGLNNPNRGKRADSGIRRSLKNPTTSQKSFQSRNVNRRASSGGFGRRSSSFRSARGINSSSRSFGGFGK